MSHLAQAFQKYHRMYFRQRKRMKIMGTDMLEYGMNPHGRGPNRSKKVKDKRSKKLRVDNVLKVIGKFADTIDDESFKFHAAVFQEQIKTCDEFKCWNETQKFNHMVSEMSRCQKMLYSDVQYLDHCVLRLIFGDFSQDQRLQIRYTVCFYQQLCQSLHSYTHHYIHHYSHSY